MSLKRPIPKYDHILRYGGLELQHMNFGEDTIQPITGSLEGKRWCFSKTSAKCRDSKHRLRVRLRTLNLGSKTVSCHFRHAVLLSDIVSLSAIQYKTIHFKGLL